MPHQTRQATRIGAEDAHMMHATRIAEARPDGVQTRRATRAGDGNGLMILRNGDARRVAAAGTEPTVTQHHAKPCRVWGAEPRGVQ